jgi:putative acetyltransferase
MTPEFYYCTTEQDYRIASALFREYADWLNIDLSFQKFDKELAELKQMYNSKDGGIILAVHEGEYIACVAVRRIDSETAELKRMYVKSSFRQKGTGQSLLDEALKLARECGYKKIKLDTLNHMTPAMELYRKNGFKETGPYYLNPNPDTVYFEKSLD